MTYEYLAIHAETFCRGRHSRSTNRGMADLSGLGVGGTAVVSGALVGLGVPEHEAVHYEGALQKCRTLSAHCDTSDEIQQASEILESTRTRSPICDYGLALPGRAGAGPNVYPHEL